MPLVRRIEKVLVERVPGVVDEVVDLEPTLLDGLHQLGNRTGLTEIQGERHDVDAVLRFKFSRELVQAVGAPGGDHQVVALPGKQPGVGRTDAG